MRGYWYQDSMNTNLSHAASYGYDAVNRLTHAQATGNATYNLEYNFTADGSDGRYGNMTCTLNGQTNGICSSVTFDPATNRVTTSSGYSYDQAGNVLADGSQGYTWDAEGRLATVTRGSVTTTFTHYASGQIARRSQTDWTMDYLYDPFGSPVAHYDAGNARWLDRYIRLGGRIVAYYGYGCPPYTRFFHADGLGSMRQATDAAGNYVETALDYPCGQMWANTGDGLDQNFAGMPDRALDLDMYLTPNRQLAINQTRWLSPDPGGLKAVHLDDPQTWNMYAYVRNNPTTLTDPSGLCWDWAKGVCNAVNYTRAQLAAWASVATQTTHDSIARSEYLKKVEALSKTAGSDRSTVKAAARTESSPAGAAIAEATRPAAGEPSRVGGTANGGWGQTPRFPVFLARRLAPSKGGRPRTVGNPAHRKTGRSQHEPQPCLPRRKNQETCLSPSPGSKSERHFVRFLPTGRKEGKNSVDRTGGLWIRLAGEGRARNAAPPPGGEDEGPGRCEKNRTNYPTEGEVPWSRRREKSGVGNGYEKKDVNN